MNKPSRRLHYALLKKPWGGSGRNSDPWYLIDCKACVGGEKKERRKRWLWSVWNSNWSVQVRALRWMSYSPHSSCLRQRHDTRRESYTYCIMPVIVFDCMGRSFSTKAGARGKIYASKFKFYLIKYCSDDVSRRVAGWWAKASKNEEETRGPGRIVTQTRGIWTRPAGDWLTSTQPSWASPPLEVI